MKWCSVVGFLVAVLGAVSEEVVNEPDFEGMNPLDIEKMMIEELGKPKGSGKDNFNFTKTVQPILDNFKKQLIADKKKMRKQLNDDIAAIHKCIKQMQKSARLGLLELDGEKKKKKCPSDKQVKKCEIKIKKLKPKQKACKALEGIGKKDVDSILKLIKQWYLVSPLSSLQSFFRTFCLFHCLMSFNMESTSFFPIPSSALHAFCFGFNFLILISHFLTCLSDGHFFFFFSPSNSRRPSRALFCICLMHLWIAAMSSFSCFCIFFLSAISCFLKLSRMGWTVLVKLKLSFPLPLGFPNSSIIIFSMSRGFIPSKSGSFTTSSDTTPDTATKTPSTEHHFISFSPAKCLLPGTLWLCMSLWLEP